MKQRIACAFLALLALAANAQEDSLRHHRTITKAVSYGLGVVRIYDAYLSPQEYTGPDLRFSRETMRLTRLFGGRKVSLQNFFQSDIAYTTNQSDNNNTVSALFNWNYGLHYNLHLGPGLRLLLGGLGDLNAGFVYNLRDSNNPASVRAYLNLDASGMLIWEPRVWNARPVIRYQVNTPVVGVMFSPNYGQSYYEIFTLGNWDGVFRLTSLHEQPSVRQMLTVDLPIRRTTLRLSYLWDIQQSCVNGLRTHTCGHIFMVGFVQQLYRIR